MEIYLKPYFAAVSIAFSFIGFAPYIRAILRNEAKPHAFSWLIWGVSTMTVFVAQIYSGGGLGSWALGLTGVITLVIAILSYCKKSDDSIAKIDWIFLCAALSAIPLWFFTANPLYAVIVLTVVDSIGYLPTLRKAYCKPFEERALLFFIMIVSSIFSIAALENYVLTNVLFQTATITGNVLLIAVILIRRRFLYKFSGKVGI